MGIEEIKKYLDGEVLENHTDWSQAAGTASKGFCFFPANPPPESRLHYLSGVVDFDVVAEFEAPDVLVLTKSKGRYRDPDEALPESLMKMIFNPPKMIYTDEFSMETYSRKTLKLVRMGTVIMEKRDWKILWDSDVFQEAEMRKLRRQKVEEVFGSVMDMGKRMAF